MTCATVIDNDSLPPSVHTVVSVDGPDVVEEGGTPCWLITLNSPVSGSPLLLVGTLSGPEQAVHSYPAPTVTIPIGQNQGYMCVPTIDDTDLEADLDLCLVINTGARISSVPPVSCAVIADNDDVLVEVPETLEGYDACCTVEGPPGTQVAWIVSFRNDGGTSVGTNCFPALDIGNWLVAGAPEDYEVSATLTDENGHAGGGWYPLSSTVNFIYRYTLSGSSGGRFVATRFSIRRAIDGVVLAGPSALSNVQIGVNTECV